MLDYNDAVIIFDCISLEDFIERIIFHFVEWTFNGFSSINLQMCFLFLAHVIYK